jgi:ethanolamine transporter EutH
MVNEAVGWILVLASLVLGLYMGVKFQREDWLGGYNAFARRMVRLAHIALAALGALNILFAQTVPSLQLDAPLVRTASVCFVIGAVSMPTSCLWLATRRRNFGVFVLPVVCLLTGLILTIGGLLR